MTEEKARRAVVQLGTVEVEGYQLPDGSYRFSQTAAAEVIGNPEIGSRRFLTSKAIKALLGKTYRPDTFAVEREGRGGNPQINGLPLEVVSAYWFTQAQKGNKRAAALSWALITESLERRFDAAFGVEVSEADRNETLSQRIEQLEQDMGEAYASEDLLRQENRLLWQYLEDEGLSGPYQLPSDANE